ncbi:MAG: oligosaccharide flippase family protein [Planctomycetota bacterium]
MSPESAETEFNESHRTDFVASSGARETSPQGDSAKRRLALQFVSTVGVAFLIVALQLAQGVLLARLLGPIGRGEYATAILYSQLLLYVGLLGGLEVICRHAAASTIEKEQLRRAALKLGLTVGGLTTLVAVGLSSLALPPEKQFLIPLAILASLSIMGQQVMLIMTAVDRGRGEFGTYNTRRIIAAAAFPVLLLGTQLFFGMSLSIACSLFVVASIISMAACVVGLRRPLSGESEPSVGSLLRECRPYALNMFATDFFDRLDLLLVTWLVSLEDQGFYAAMVPAVYPLTVIPNTMGLFLFNAGADEEKRLTRSDVHRILASSIAIQTVCTLVFMLLIGFVVQILYGDSFAPAVEFALWLAPVAAIKGILQGLDSYVKGRGKPMASIGCRVVAAITVVLVTWLLLNERGAVAIAMAALVGQVLCLIWLSAIVYADVATNDSSAE